MDHKDGAKALLQAWARPAKLAAGSWMWHRATHEELASSPWGGQRQRAGKKKILVPTKRKVSFQHSSYLDKTGGEKHFKEIVKEPEPRGRCHQRQWFPIPSSNGKGLPEVIPKKDLSPAVSTAL